MKYYLFMSAFLLLNMPAFPQEAINPITKRIIVKTNVLSLIAKRPTLTVEKLLSKNFSAEISFIQGEFNNILLTDHYSYNGFLIRAKEYFTAPDYGKVSPYAALYAGNLKRNIQTEGRSIDANGYIGYPSRDFSANSIRAGGTLGLSYITKNKFIIDGLGSLGYGRYIKIYKPDEHWNGYLDVQIWLSLGYCF